MDIQLAPTPPLSYEVRPVSSRTKPWFGVARLGSMGDNLIASSVLPLLAQNHRVEVLTQRPAGVIFENNPHIDKLTYLDPANMPQGCGLEWQQYFAKRGKEYDGGFVHLSHSIEVALALIPAQTSFYWPAHMRRKMCGRSYLEFTHDLVGVPYVFDPRFYPTADEKQQAVNTKSKIGERVIGWCLSGSRLDKVYPYAPMAVARLIRELDVPVVTFGAEGKDFELGKVIHEHVKRQNGTDRNFHLALSPEPPKQPEWSIEGGAHVTLKPPAEPLWPLRRSLSQLQQCDLVIGPDTGLMWGVAMEAMPKLVLLSHASPENIIKHWWKTIALTAYQGRVPCWPCHQLHDDSSTCTPNRDNNGAACISDISAEAIVTMAAKLLTEGD